MDELHWGPGWVDSSAEEMDHKVRDAFDKAGDSWVIDGDYLRRGGIVACERATDIICMFTIRSRHFPTLTVISGLDPPLALYFPRIVFRTFMRLVGLVPPCSPGCPESIKEVFFSKTSIIWWCISHHSSNRKKGRDMMIEYGGIVRRIGGWGGEYRTWMAGIGALVGGLKDVA